MAGEDRTDADLLAGCRDDPDGFAVFYARHVGAVLAFAVRRTRDAETGADVTAETFAVALLQARRFDPSRGSALGWLLGIARNKVLMLDRDGAVEHRARQRLGIPRLELTEEGIERIERLASLRISGGVLAEALEELPSSERVAVLARIVDEEPYERIAQLSDASPALARQRVSRGLAHLRKRLGIGP